MNYFIGLDLEFMGKEEEMEERYDALKDLDCDLDLPLSFLPYYRTAKFAQREAENSKALYYYGKALQMFDGKKIASSAKTDISHILYDISTVYLYCHRYSDARRVLDISYKYSRKNDDNREFVSAILYAVEGDEKKCTKLLSSLSPIHRNAGMKTAKAILSKTEPHYFELEYDLGTKPIDFMMYVTEKGDMIGDLAEKGDVAVAQEMIGKMLSETFPYVGRTLECRIEKDGKNLLVKCKNYCIKTLGYDYRLLFEMANKIPHNIRFLSVEEFEKYPEINI
jgi:hypothetical protein